MANSYVNKVVVGGVSRLDLTGDTVTAEDLLAGKTAHDASGTAITGTMTDRGTYSNTIITKAQSCSIPAGHYTGGSVSISSTEQAKIIASNIKSGVTLLGVTGNLVSANLNVVAYASAFPTSASANTIGIISSVAVTKYMVSTSAPTSGLQEGYVWIKIGDYSPTPLSVGDSSHTIKVYPIAAQQYQNGAWVSVEVKAYYNGAWVAWISKCYWDGTNTLRFASANGCASFANYGIVISASNSFLRVCSQDPINCKGYSKLCIDFKYSSGLQIAFGLNSSYNTENELPNVASKYTGTSTGIKTLDISKYNSNLYVKLARGDASGTQKYNSIVYRIWLEG